MGITRIQESKNRLIKRQKAWSYGKRYASKNADTQTGTVALVSKIRISL